MTASRRLVESLRTSTPLIGSWIQTGSPAAAEMLADAGFHWLGLDCEHSSSDIATVESIARAIQGRDTALLVRVTQCDAIEIRRCLDVGASGVIVPMVESAEQARRAVRAAKYPPLGNRGYCFGRMNQWGGRFDDYARTANDGTIVVAMIESRAGVENIEAILAVEGLSGVFIGPYDLSGSYGLPGQLQHEVVRRAYDSVVRACRAARVPAGQHIVHSTQAKIETAMAEGFTLICLDADSIFIREAARTALAAATGSTP
jgi:2-keto-3-deoxy-L-rhamnonate aldolase RhmA